LETFVIILIGLVSSIIYFFQNITKDKKVKVNHFLKFIWNFIGLVSLGYLINLLLPILDKIIPDIPEEIKDIYVPYVPWVIGAIIFIFSIRLSIKSLRKSTK
jgi:hypothetical protein